MPAGILGRKTIKHRRNRRMSGQNTRPVRPTPIAIVSSDWNDVDLTIVFNQPVSLKEIPMYRTNGGAAPTAAELVAPNTIKLTYPAAAKNAPSIIVPAEDPAVRNSSGGFVSPTSVTV